MHGTPARHEGSIAGEMDSVLLASRLRLWWLPSALHRPSQRSCSICRWCLLASSHLSATMLCASPPNAVLHLWRVPHEDASSPFPPAPYPASASEHLNLSHTAVQVLQQTHGAMELVDVSADLAPLKRCPGRTSQAPRH